MKDIDILFEMIWQIAKQANLKHTDMDYERAFRKFKKRYYEKKKEQK